MNEEEFDFPEDISINSDESSRSDFTIDSFDVYLNRNFENEYPSIPVTRPHHLNLAQSTYITYKPHQKLLSMKFNAGEENSDHYEKPILDDHDEIDPDFGTEEVEKREPQREVRYSNAPLSCQDAQLCLSYCKEKKIFLTPLKDVFEMNVQLDYLDKTKSEEVFLDQLEKDEEKKEMDGLEEVNVKLRKKESERAAEYRRKSYKFLNDRKLKEPEKKIEVVELDETEVEEILTLREEIQFLPDVPLPDDLKESQPRLYFDKFFFYQRGCNCKYVFRNDKEVLNAALRGNYIYIS
eukprot:snap_masked-scaffold_23-processed-gene-2.6-mRNA-1 protein AED:1.00 eAED:1.00 QI:0/0/0/0/1/1/4/0/293